MLGLVIIGLLYLFMVAMVLAALCVFPRFTIAAIIWFNGHHTAAVVVFIVLCFLFPVKKRD